MNSNKNTTHNLYKFQTKGK